MQYYNFPWTVGCSVSICNLQKMKCIALLLLLLLLPLAPQPSLGLGLLHKTWLNFVDASQQFSLLQGRVVSPTPNPTPQISD
jgi:hypothetical protein